jgi:ankyrin repeat protein
MCTDIINLCNSYLPINNIFLLYNLNKKRRDKILKIYKRKIPNIEDACELGYFEIVRYLYHNRNIKNIIFKPKTINIASKYGHLKIVIFLFKHNVKPSHHAINDAAANGYLNIVEFLIKHVKPTKDAIKWASYYGYLDIVKFLVKNYIKPTSEALVYASTKGHLEIVKYLVSVGIEPSYNAMDQACNHGRLEIVRYFIEDCGYHMLSYDIKFHISYAEYNRSNVAKYLKTKL